MKRLLIAAASLAAFSSPQVHAAPLVAPCTQTSMTPTQGECDPVNSNNPLPVTGGITTGVPGAPADATSGPNVVTIQGVRGMTPIAVRQGGCPPNPISKIAGPWPFCQ